MLALEVVTALQFDPSELFGDINQLSGIGLRLATADKQSAVKKVSKCRVR
jgi:hypothetical protein